MEQKNMKAHLEFEKQKKSSLLPILVDRVKDKPLDVELILGELTKEMVSIIKEQQNLSEGELNYQPIQLMDQIEDMVIKYVAEFNSYKDVINVNFLERKTRRKKQVDAAKLAT